MDNDSPTEEIESDERRRSGRRRAKVRSPYSPTRSPVRPVKRKSRRDSSTPLPTPPQERKKYECADCPYTVFSPSDLAKHVVHHGLHKKFKCAHCDFSADLNNSVKRHETVHRKTPKHVPHVQEDTDLADTAPVLSPQTNKMPSPKPKFRTPKQCQDCPFQTPMPDLFRTHVEGHKRVTGYKCPKCSFRAAFYGIIVKHMPLHESHDSPASKRTPGKVQLQCCQCRFTSTSADRLETHKLRHDPEFRGVLECGTCFFQTLDPQEFDDHDRKHDQSTEDEAESDAASATPVSPPVKRRHGRVTRSPIETRMVEGNKVFLCPKCPYYGKRATDLRKHVRHHGVDGVHHCPQCDYASNSQHAVSIHVKLHNHQLGNGDGSSGNEAPILSDEASPPKLVRERGNDNSRSRLHTCKLCPTTFRRHRAFLSHSARHKLTATCRFTCPCSYTAKGRLQLTVHLVSAHANVMYDLDRTKNTSRKVVIGSHRCFACRRAWRTGGQMVSHNYKRHKPACKQMTVRAWKLRRKLCVKMPVLMQMKKRTQPAPKLTKHAKPNVKECPHCPYRTPQTTELKKHILRHSANDPIKCIDCTFSCTSSISLAHHKKIHAKASNKDGANATEDSTAYFKCEECPYTTRFPYDLGNHSKRHNGEGPFACTYCSYKAQRKGHIRKHQLLHTDSSAIKRALGAKSNQTAPTAFEKQIYSKEGDLVGTLMSGDCYRVYSCISCPFRTPLNSSLIAHSRLHIGERVFKCSDCSFNTDVQRRLTDHMKVHNNKYSQSGPGDMLSDRTSGWAPKIRSPYSKAGSMYKCDYCPHTTKSYTGLWYHLQKHKKAGKYKCVKCSFATSSIACMRRHDIVHSDHDVDTTIVKKEVIDTTITAPPAVVDGKTSFKCPHCPFVSATHGSYCHHLKMHRQNKTGPKDYSCPHCSFSTSAKTTLNKHLVLHDTPEMQYLAEEPPVHVPTRRSQAKPTAVVTKPENPLQCVHCPHLAQSKQLLSIHKRMHKGRRPYKCPHCSFSVQHESSLKSHLLLHLSGPTSGRDRSDRILSAVIKRAAANHLLTYSKKYPTSIESNPRDSWVQCPICSYKTRNPERLVAHHNEKHAILPVKSEVQNGESSSTSHASTPPVATPSGEGIQYYCSKCSFRTEHQANLLKHTSMHGAQDNTFMCSVCDYSCKQARVVRFHEQNHHNYVPFSLLFSDQEGTRCREYVNGVCEPRRKAPLQCTLCPFTTVGVQGLTEHWKQHESNEDECQQAKCNIFLAGLSLLPTPKI